MSGTAVTTRCALRPLGVDEIFREHHAWALGFARRILGHNQDAEDVVAEVFLATLRAHRVGRGPNENVRAYLRRAIQNEATRVYARRRLETVTDTVPDAPARNQYPEVDRALDRDRVLRGCPPSWPLLIFHVDVCGLSAEEAAGQLGMTKFAAVSVLYRARTALRLAA